MSFDYFKYPPDFDVARLHKESTRPGRPILDAPHCPCCDQPPKKVFDSWLNRSIEKDFKDFGGAVISYFWLIKLYAITTAVVIAVYSIYLSYVTQTYCNEDHLDKCTKLLGLWVVTNSDIYNIVRTEGDSQILVRLSTLRGAVFLILLLVNALSMHIVRTVKKLYPENNSISDYSLFFKNVSGNVDNLKAKIEEDLPGCNIREAFIVRRIEPYYTLYDKKLKSYYACKIAKKDLKAKKQVKRLLALQKKATEKEMFMKDPRGNRAIVTFNTIDEQKKAFEKYQIGICDKIKLTFSATYDKQLRMYCSECPKPEQILWHNLGKVEDHGKKTKILSIVYFFASLGISYLMLFFCMEILYNRQLEEPFQTILQNVLLFFVVVVALSFRQLMNKLSEMRHPNTYTSRTMFIVLTTVLFHFIYYLIIPTLYLRVEAQRRAEIIKLISNQTLTFITVQIILAGFDLMHCCWKRRLPRVEDQQHPIGCQKILHNQIQFPRFPIEFKLIVLFKFWSFITFFAFQVPLVLFFILVVLVYLYIKDKHSVYHHYRMEIIDNSVQFSFLRIYSNFFSIYMYFIFVFTQSIDFEIYAAIAITALIVIFQTYFFRSLKKQQQLDESFILPPSYQDLENVKGYEEQYRNFIQKIQSDAVDNEIREFLKRKGFESTESEDSLISKMR